MKLKADFVTNSSSTAFIITNLTSSKKDLIDFVRENPHLIEEFNEEYGYGGISERYTQENLLISAATNNIEFEPNEYKECVFGDEDGTIIGSVFDYILRDGGQSKSFRWRFYESRR